MTSQTEHHLNPYPPSPCEPIVDWTHYTNTTLNNNSGLPVSTCLT